VAAQVAGLHRPEIADAGEVLLVQQRLDERPPGIARQSLDGHVLVPRSPDQIRPEVADDLSSRVVSTSSSTGMRSAYAVGPSVCRTATTRTRRPALAAAFETAVDPDADLGYGGEEAAGRPAADARRSPLVHPSRTQQEDAVASAPVADDRTDPSSHPR
jgi:hypothetical protein